MLGLEILKCKCHTDGAGASCNGNVTLPTELEPLAQLDEVLCAFISKES